MKLTADKKKYLNKLYKENIKSFLSQTKNESLKTEIIKKTGYTEQLSPAGKVIIGEVLNKRTPVISRKNRDAILGHAYSKEAQLSGVHLNENYKSEVRELYSQAISFYQLILSEKRIKQYITKETT